MLGFNAIGRVAIGQIQQSYYGGIIAPLFAGSYILAGNVANFSISETGLGAIYLVATHEAALQRDFINWAHDPLASGSWTGIAGGSSTWSPAPTPSTIWTVDPAQQIPMPVAN